MPTHNRGNLNYFVFLLQDNLRSIPKNRAAAIGHNWPVFIGFGGGGGRVLPLASC